MKKLRLDFNAPVILCFSFASMVLLIFSSVLGSKVNAMFAIHYTSWLDPMMYVRFFTYVFAHANLSHFLNNFLLVLAIGPMVEEKYGSSRLLSMMAICAAITGLINVIFFPRVMLLGASGIVFMLILLASFTNFQDGKIPVTFILVCALYIGSEVYSGIFANDNISQLTHIAGGIFGSIFGFQLKGGRIK